MHFIIFINIPEAGDGKGKKRLSVFEISSTKIKTFRKRKVFILPSSIPANYGTMVMVAETIFSLVCPVNV